MPVALVDRLPLPNLKAYTAGSVLLMSVALFHALSVTNDPEWKVQTAIEREQVVATGTDGEVLKVVQLENVPDQNISINGTKNLTEQLSDVMMFMMQEPLCMWTVINMAYCALALFGFGVQRAVFGQLRAAETQRAKDKLWNFAFYKFIFVFGVVSVQYVDEVLLWCAWFTLVGFLHLLAQLAGDRFEYLSSSSGAGGGGARARLLALLGGVQAACGALMLAALRVGLPRGRDIFAFMAAECVLVSLSALHVVARLALQALEADAAGPLAYYTHLLFEAGALGVEVSHVVHMVVHSNMVVSMASLVLLMQLRHLLGALQLRLRRHRVYWALARHMARSYPMASKEEVEKNQDNCAICWEPMKEARKLPCSHLFHNGCLCQWVQQDASCPTCRRALSPHSPAVSPHSPSPAASPLASPAPPPAAAGLAEEPPLAAAAPARRHNHMFHFDGSRYVSWLPSFSLEVTRVRPPPSPDHIDAMVRQVQAVFPQYPARVLAAALAASRSAAATADDILAGRLPPPPPPSPPPEPEEMEEEAPPMEPPASEAPALDDAEESSEEGPAYFPALASEREASLRRRRARLLAAARRRLLRRDT